MVLIVYFLVPCPKKTPTSRRFLLPCSRIDRQPFTMTGGAMASEAATEADYLAAKTAVWWDFDECGVPEDCDGSAIAENIKSALSNLGYHGPVTISAYGNTDYISESVQHALSSTGVSLNHVVADDYLGLDESNIELLRELSATGASVIVASGDTAVTDSSIEQLLVDLMIDNPAPANVLIISGKNAFSAVRHLGEGYNVLMSAFLPAAVKTVWKWDTLVAGGSPIGGSGGVDALYQTSVWWDIEEFKLPDKLCDVQAISKNIKSALFKLGYRGTVSISAYGDTTDIPEPVKMALGCSEISLNHVPAGEDIKNFKLLTDLMSWVASNPAPANILFITEVSGGLSDRLHDRGYNVLLAQPSEASPLLSAGATKTVWLWPSLLAGGSPVVNRIDAAKEAKYLEAQEAKFKAAKTSVWWATDDCEIPEHCDVNAIAGNIRSALLDLGYHGPVTIFAYVDCDIPESVRGAFSSTGISLKQVPEGKIDKNILVEMISWAYKNAAPTNLLLISGERVYRHALGPLGERCNVLLSASLPAAAKTVWHWPSLLAGGSPIGSGGEVLQTRVNGNES